MELHFKPLTATWLDPLAVDSLVLLIGPEVLALDQLEATFLQSRNIIQDTLRVANLLVLECIPYSIRDNGNGLLWSTVLLFNPLGNLFLDAVAILQATIE